MHYMGLEMKNIQVIPDTVALSIEPASWKGAHQVGDCDDEIGQAQLVY